MSRNKCDHAKQPWSGRLYCWWCAFPLWWGVSEESGGIASESRPETAKDLAGLRSVAAGAPPGSSLTLELVPENDGKAA